MLVRAVAVLTLLSGAGTLSLESENPAHVHLEGAAKCERLHGAAATLFIEGFLQQGPEESFLQVEAFCAGERVAACADAVVDAEPCKLTASAVVSGPFSCRITTSQRQEGTSGTFACMLGDGSRAESQEFSPRSGNVREASGIRHDCRPLRESSGLSGEVRAWAHPVESPDEPSFSEIGMRQLNWACSSEPALSRL